MLFKLKPLVISLLAAQGMMIPALPGWAAVIQPFTPEKSDNKVGVFCVCNGSTQSLTGLPQFAPGKSGAVSTTLGQLQDQGRLFSDTLTGRERLSLGAQNNEVFISDVANGLYSHYSTYNTAALSNLAPIGLDQAVTDYEEVNDQQYLNARVASVSNGTINVQLGTPGASTQENGWEMAAKQSRLFSAIGSGNMNWDADNRIDFTAIQAPNGARWAYSDDQLVNYSGDFSVTTKDGSVTNFNVTNLSELQQYNDWLIAQLQTANLDPASYNNEFDKAFSFTSGSVVWALNTRDPDDEVFQPIGERIVLSADGAKATATINAGKTLEVVNANGGAMRADNGATATINGKLSSTGNNLTDNDALVLTNGSSGINNGVINGGFFNNADGSGVDSSTLGFNAATVAVNNSRFTNNGVLNHALSDGSSALTLRDGSAVNNGTVNLGVTNTVGSGSSAGVVLSGTTSSFINNGTFYIGRTPQNSATDAAADVAINQSGGTRGISQLFDSSAVNNGHIVIGSLVQNATAMRVENAPDAVTLNNGVIDVNGRAQFKPAENIAMQVINSGSGGQVGNAGIINLNGDNSSGLKVTATAGKSAHAWSTGAINVNGRADALNGTRNTAVWVNGEDGGAASADLSGPINLSGDAAIGIRAEGYATVNVAQSAVPTSGSGQYQINFLTIGPDAKLNLPSNGSYGASGWYSTIFRNQDGADFDGRGMTLTPNASFSTGVFGSGEGTDINTNGATLNIGGYSTGIVVEGGAQGTIDAATQLNFGNYNSLAALVDGNKHDLTGYITNSLLHPFNNTSLTNHAAMSSDFDRQMGLIAQNQAQLINTGNISFGGSDTVGIQSLRGANVTNSGDISVNNGSTALYAEGFSFSDSVPATINNTGTLNVTAGNAPDYAPTHGILGVGDSVEINQNGTINLYGSNAVGVELLDGGLLRLGENSKVVFHDENQTGYISTAAFSNIVTNGGQTDVSKDGSTLYRIGSGTIFYPLQPAAITLSGANTTGINASGMGTTIFGSDHYDVTGNGATAVRAAEGAYGIINNGINLTGANSVGAATDGGGAALYITAPITGSGDNVTALSSGNGSRIDNQSNIELTGNNDVGARLYYGGNLINRGTIHVNNGVGVDVSNGYGQYTQMSGQLQVDNGSALRVSNGGVLNIVGDGADDYFNYTSTTYAGNNADTVLIDHGASVFIADHVVLSAYKGNVINNRAETSNISLNRARLEINGGNAIRSATSFDPTGSAYIGVSEGVGYLFENEDGSTTSNDLLIGPNYYFFITGSNSTGVRANTTGRVINEGTLAVYNVDGMTGGSAIVTSTASEVINRGSIISLSTQAPIIDLRGGQSVFINQGNLSAPIPGTVIVAGGASNDQFALLSGSVVGDVNTGNGNDTLQLSGGTIDGSLTMGSGNNQALVENVSLAKTRHITTDNGAGSTLSFNDINARGASLAADDLSKGTNLGGGWSTINFYNTQWTLTDNLKLAHSTINIGQGSTLFAGDGVNPLLSGATDGSLVVNNAGTLDLTNGSGAPGNTLTIDGDLASTGGHVKLNTPIVANGISDSLRVNGNTSGTTLLDVTPIAGSAAIITPDQGISLAQVTGSASANSFALSNGYVASGPWQYGLYATQNTAAWDYRLANNVVTDTAGNVVRPKVTPQMPSYISAPVGLAYYNMAVMDDLHKRLGELRADSSNGSGEMFIRYLGSNLKYKTNRDLSQYGYDFDLDYSAVQLGGNLLHLQGTSDSLRAGLAYTRGNARIRPDAVDGYSSTSFDNDTLSLYATWLRDSGFYLDGALSFDWHRGDTDIARQKEVGKLKGNGWGASLETGYPWQFANGVRIEPQAQLMYLQLDMDDVVDRDNTRVSWSNYDQTIGRVGARLDRTWQEQAGQQYTPYLRTSYTRGWGGSVTTRAGANGSPESVNFDSGKFGQMWDVGIGGTATLKRDVSLYAEADYRQEIDGNGTKGWRYNAGVRWMF
ncbi:autotransporter outer membrane beta-barrel domain-containing protein [Pantoea endophytica]|uniref:autotransporter outer membrane beta-barrel domain-containing protein n=1 Tax=Pantoea endophytica TaxID=92488 RepID=UPI00241366A3|nr:autotransporter outer membrane beta-barrel domain-containing protein [Pantoea endophytica]